MLTNIRLHHKYWKARFNAHSTKSFFEMDMLSISFVIVKDKDNETVVTL